MTSTDQLRDFTKCWLRRLERVKLCLPIRACSTACCSCAGATVRVEKVVIDKNNRLFGSAMDRCLR